MTPDKLHRVHVYPSTFRLDVGGNTGLSYRPESSAHDADTKAAVARRLAVCWNVLEGMPTHELEEGVLSDVFEAAWALSDACALLLRTDDLPDELREAHARLFDALSRGERAVDRTRGRLHDCTGCLGESEPEPVEVDWLSI